MTASTGGHRTRSTRSGRAATAPKGDSRPVAEAASRRQEILDISAELFAEKGFAETTVRDIAAKAGILSGSLYHHFASKDEMLEEIIRTSLDADIARDHELASRPDLDPAAAVSEMFQRALSFVADHPHVAAILAAHPELRSPTVAQLVGRRGRAIRQAWTTVLQRCVDAGAFRADLDVEVAYRAMISCIDGATRWFRPDGPKPIATIADELTHLFLAGMAAPAPAPRPAKPTPKPAKPAPKPAPRRQRKAPT